MTSVHCEQVQKYEVKKYGSKNNNKIQLARPHLRTSHTTASTSHKYELETNSEIQKHKIQKYKTKILNTAC